MADAAPYLWLSAPSPRPPAAAFRVGDLLHGADLAAAVVLLHRVRTAADSGTSGRAVLLAAACIVRFVKAFQWRAMTDSQLPQVVPGRSEFLLSVLLAAVVRLAGVGVRSREGQVRLDWAIALTAALPLLQHVHWGLVHPGTLLFVIYRKLWFKLLSMRAVLACCLRDGSEGLPQSRGLAQLVMRVPPFPTRPCEIPERKEWVRLGLVRSGVLPESAAIDVSVETLSGKPLGEGGDQGPRGFMGETVRVRLSCSSGCGPAAVVAKFASQRAATRLKMRDVAPYLRECEFYRLRPLGTSLRPADQSDPDTLRVPECYNVSYDDRDAAFALLLEAMAGGGDETKAASEDMACSVARRYASLHAANWSRSVEELDAKGWGWLAWHDWMYLPQEATHKLLSDTVTEMLRDDRYRAICGPAEQELFGLLANGLRPLLTELRSRPATLIHADARQENMLFTADGDWASCDWQTFTKGVGIYDVAYFSSLCCEPRDPDFDRNLVRTYRAALVKRGVDLAGYSEEQCWDDYRVCALIAACIPVAVMDPRTIDAEGSARAVLVRVSMLRRVVALLRRTNAAEAVHAALERARGPCRTLRCVFRPAAGRDIPAAPLTAADEQFGHHHPQSLAELPEESRRDAYDRWFLNGFPSDNCSASAPFFAVAFGVYPARRVVDASFCVLVNGRQHNIRASRHLDDDEWPQPDAPPAEVSAWSPLQIRRRVGPIEITVLDPLQSVRVSLEPGLVPGFSAFLTFQSRFPASKEPRFETMLPGVGVMEYERLTQLVEWSGALEVCGTQYTATRWWGVRDRSWGIRPHRHADPEYKAASKARTMGNPMGRWFAGRVLRAQQVLGKEPPQFYWLWCPLHLPAGGLQYHSNESADGAPWNSDAAVFGDIAPEAEDLQSSWVQVGEGAGKQPASSPTAVVSPRTQSTGVELPLSPLREQHDRPKAGHAIKYRRGCRHADVTAIGVRSAARTVGLRCSPTGRTFFMSGLGYSHPTWGHGQRHDSPLALTYDTIDVAAADPMDSTRWHIQEVVRVDTFRVADAEAVTGLATSPASEIGGREAFGVGVVEQLVVGPHAPSSFAEAFDATP